jgi:DNA helicase-4
MIGGILFLATFLSVVGINIFISGFSFATEPSWIWSGSLIVLTTALIWKTVVVDVQAISDETHWNTTATRWGVLAVGIPIIGPAAYLYKRHSVVTSAREKRFHVMCDQFEDRLFTLLDSIQPYLNTESYLTGHDQETFASRSATLQTELQTLRSSVEATTGIATAHPLIRGFEHDIAEIGQLLTNRDRYNDRFVEIELRRRQSFFDAVGQDETTLDRNQREAIVRNDSHNRVIAGAGTGKTLVLTTRVAYFVKYQAVDPADILVVTFLNEAAEEMQRRLREEFGITGIKASTLHSFGYSVIANTTGEKPDVFDDDDLEHLVDDVLEQRTELVPETFYDHFSNFLLQSELPTVSETDFETKEEFVEYLQHQDYETLGGESVKSRAEKLIADFLHVHQVDYQYEYRADLDQPQGDQTASDSDSIDSDADETVTINAYRPDFYLPEADIWIEHYGIDENGDVAEWFTQSSEEYIKKIHWAREVFEDRDAVLLETYQFEFDTGRLRQALTHRLTHHNVSLNRRSHEELVNETYEIHNRNIPIRQMFTRFIELARTFEIEPSQIPSRLSIEQPAQYYFGMCGGLLLDAYETRLRKSGNIDFTDMIYEAASLLSTGPDTAAHKYEHVLVDEFQDIGQDQLQLITQLSGPNDAQLFAVGDDWQSIYSFQGAVVDLFINFEERFEYTATTTLDTNYRSPSQLVKASVELIEENEDQLVKQTTAASDAPAAVVKHLLGGYRQYDYVKYTAELVAHLVADYVASGCDPNEIMVLCRYDDAVSHLDAVRKRLHDRSIPYTSGGGGDQQDGVTVCSVHQAKGREADHVIITHASEDGMGFPATDRNSELLEPVREVDMNTLAEERRLFYVAITRSAQTLDVITKSNQQDQSRFIDEIDQYVDTATDADRIVSLDPTKNQNTLQARVAHLWDDTHAKKHQGGVLEDHTDSVKFVSWANTEPPTVETDTWYRFENISVNEYKGDPQVVINGFSELTEIEPEDARVDVETIHYQLSQDDSSDGTPPNLNAPGEE